MKDVESDAGEFSRQGSGVIVNINARLEENSNSSTLMMQKKSTLKLAQVTPPPEG